IKDGITYRMWYAGRNAAGTYAIGYATSGDGVIWTKHAGNPVLTIGGLGAWDSQIVREPSVVKDGGGTYHMWYAGTDNWPRFNIGHATSPDGIAWTKDSANPVLVGTAGQWDANETYAPSVVMNGGVFEMFYSGENGNRWLEGHASSPDGTVWTKDDNAILSPETTGWETGDSTDYASAVLDGGAWKLFYSGAGSGGYQIGLATLISQAQLTFRPMATSLAVGGSTDVYVDLTSVTNLYGYQFQVSYDMGKVSATGAFVDSFFDTDPDASIPPSWNASCAAGVCKFAVSKLAPATASTGSGPLAKITFTGAASGLTALTFTSDILSDKDGNTITHSKTTGWLTVYGTATINGTVNLQGRGTPITDGTVTLTERYGIFAPVTVPFDGATGAFSASVPVDGPTEYILVASHSLYLSNKLGDSLTGGGIVISSGTVTAPTTTLKGGDANNDGTIGLGDLTCIGGDFGGVPGTCGGTGSSDINGDTMVNILDLVLPGGNYGLSTPQPW
ncbi:MAG: cohesin domain-containing protein, partial [Chloroflexota bacterium]